MDKKTAIDLLGGSTRSAAREIGVTPQAITNWPDELTPIMQDRVQAALYRRLSQRSRSPRHGVTKADQGGEV